jgi:hypothetical protein
LSYSVLSVIFFFQKKKSFYRSSSVEQEEENENLKDFFGVCGWTFKSIQKMEQSEGEKNKLYRKSNLHLEKCFQLVG